MGKGVVIAGVLSLAFLSYCGSVVVRSAAPAAAPTQLTVVSSSDEVWTQTTRRVSGEVRNDGAAAVVRPQVSITYYDAAGKVLATDFTFVDADQSTLQPGQTRPFTLYPIVTNPARYVLNTRS